jgi:hypothetical protein
VEETEDERDRFPITAVLAYLGAERGLPRSPLSFDEPNSTATQQQNAWYVASHRTFLHWRCSGAAAADFRVYGGSMTDHQPLDLLINHPINLLRARSSVWFN